MKRISANFTLEELYESQTALRMGINNVPGNKEIEALTRLTIKILQPVRDYFNKPVAITSGFRSAALNRAIGGVYNSQHQYGEAADIRINGIGNDVIWEYIRANLVFDQVILEHVPSSQPTRGWVHVSYKDGANRNEAISCVKAGDYRPGLVYSDEENNGTD